MCDVSLTIIMTILISSIYYNIKFYYIKKQAIGLKNACKEFSKISVEDTEKISQYETILKKIKKRFGV